MIQKTGSTKTGSALLLIGGVFQMLAAAVHAAMFFGFSRASDLPAAIVLLLYLFNAAVLATVLFFAYVSFFRRKELLETGLGRATCLFIGFFYIQRGLVEALLSGVNPGSLGLLGLIAMVYLFAPFAARPVGGRAIEGAAITGTSSH